MPIFVDKDKILVSNHKSDIIFAKENNMREINQEDISLEETTLKGIISSCENLLDDLEVGNNVNESDMKALIYAENVILDIQQRIGSNLSPTHIKGGYYPEMTDRVYCDDEHGNAL